MTNTTQTVDKMVGVYRRIRAAITEKETAHEQEINKLKADLELVANKLLDICKEQGADSIKTANGTVIRNVKSRYWTTDWGSMYSTIKEYNAPFLLEQRIHNGNMKQFLEENPDAFPPGLQIDNKYTITVRKPTSK